MQGCNGFPTSDFGPDEEHCETRFKLTLFDQATLQNTFSDRARVVRILGSIHYLWQLTSIGPGDTADALSSLLSTTLQLFSGLRVDDVNSDGQTQSFRPIEAIQDYTEARWLRTWEKWWYPSDGLRYGANGTVQGGFNGCCPNVTGNIPAIHTGTAEGDTTGADIASGTGHWTTWANAGTIQTDCAPCEVPTTYNNVTTDAGVTKSYPQPYRQRLALRKRIPMREDQQLDLHTSWSLRDFTGGHTTPTDLDWGQVTLIIVPRVKVLIEVG